MKGDPRLNEMKEGTRVLVAIGAAADLLLTGGLVTSAASCAVAAKDLTESQNEEGFRFRRLNDLLFKPEFHAAIDGGAGTIVLDPSGRAAALGWGWNAAGDMRIDKIVDVCESPDDPAEVVLHLPAPRMSVVIKFRDARTAENWRFELERLKP